MKFSRVLFELLINKNALFDLIIIEIVCIEFNNNQFQC